MLRSPCRLSRRYVDPTAGRGEHPAGGFSFVALPCAVALPKLLPRPTPARIVEPLITHPSRACGLGDHHLRRDNRARQSGWRGRHLDSRNRSRGRDGHRRRAPGVQVIAQGHANQAAQGTANAFGVALGFSPQAGGQSDRGRRGHEAPPTGREARRPEKELWGLSPPVRRGGAFSAKSI